MTLGQRLWHVQLARSGQQEVVVEAHFLDDCCELSAQVWLGAADFLVCRAQVSTHRLAGQPAPGLRELTELRGVEFYLGAGQALKQATQQDPTGGLWREALVEALRAVIQGEALLTRERGFTSPAQYDSWFNAKFAGSCWYYLNLQRVQQEFHQYIADQNREDLLFQRFRHTRVARGGEGFTITSQLADSFHQAVLELEVGADGLITGVQAELTRCPDPVCREAVREIENLQGRRLDPEQYRVLSAAAGGPQGCTHLGDLTVEAARAWQRQASTYLDRKGCS